MIDGKGNLSLVVNLHDATVTEAARRRGYDHLVAAVGDLNG